MEVVAGAAAVVRKTMVGDALGVLVVLPKQSPYTLHCPMQHTSCAHQQPLPHEGQRQKQNAGHQTASGLAVMQHVMDQGHCLTARWIWEQLCAGAI